MHHTKTLDMLDAAEHGDSKRIAMLLDETPELANASGEYDKTPLHWAAEKNFGRIAALLLDAGADVEHVTTWGSSALEWAGIMGSTTVADQLLEHGASGLNLAIAAGLGRLQDVQNFCEPKRIRRRSGHSKTAERHQRHQRLATRQCSHDR